MESHVLPVGNKGTWQRTAGGREIVISRHMALGDREPQGVDFAKHLDIIAGTVCNECMKIRYRM